MLNVEARWREPEESSQKKQVLLMLGDLAPELFRVNLVGKEQLGHGFFFLLHVEILRY